MKAYQFIGYNGECLYTTCASCLYDAIDMLYRKTDNNEWDWEFATENGVYIEP